MKNRNEMDVLFADLSICRPVGAIGAVLRAGQWRATDYETKDGIKGRMVFSVGRDHAPTLTLSMNLSGVYRIFLGVNYSRVAGHSSHGELWVKLSGDDGFVPVAIETQGPEAKGIPDPIGAKRDIFTAVLESYWRTAELSGEDLAFRPPVAPYSAPDTLSNLSYVRLEPLEGEARKRWDERCGGDGKNRNLAMLWCSGELTGSTKGRELFFPKDRQWYQDAFQPCIDSDVGIFVMEAMRGNLCLFDTRTGDVGTDSGHWPESCPETLRTFVEIAHEHDRRIFAGLRIIGAWYPVERFPIHRARFYWEHQDWAKRDKQGRPGSGLSLAFDGVRQHWLQLLREALLRGVDGVTLYFNRGAPYAFYEEPTVASFINIHGEDPRNLPISDKRWVEHCGSYVTLFLREVRALLDEQPGRELAVIFNTALFGSTDPAEVHKYYFDVDGWIEESLVDVLMPTKSVDTRWLQQWRASSGAKLKIWPDLRPRTMPGDYYVRLAQRYYEAGADGFCFWDGERRPPRISEWATARYLGHRDCLDDLELEAKGHFHRHQLDTLNGLAVPLSFRDG